MGEKFKLIFEHSFGGASDSFIFDGNLDDIGALKEQLQSELSGRHTWGTWTVYYPPGNLKWSVKMKEDEIVNISRV